MVHAARRYRRRRRCHGPQRSGQDTGFRWVGCSNTWQAVQGFEDAGGRALWAADDVVRLKRGSLDRWADPESKYWDYLADMKEKYPQTEEIFWQICLRADTRTDVGPRPTDSEKAMSVAVLRMIRDHFPRIPVHVSALNEYDGIVCTLTGRCGPAASAALADRLVRKGRAESGPVLTALTRGTHRGDRCHAGPEGVADWGMDLGAFFGLR